MEKVIKKLFLLFLVIVLSLAFIYPASCDAISNTTTSTKTSNSTEDDDTVNSTSNTTSMENVLSNLPSTLERYSYYDYVIDKYDIDVVVNENNTFDITETITAFFNTAKHGIFRTIPLRNTVTRVDGTTSKNRAQITNLDINAPYTTKGENGNCKIQIGDPDRTVRGSHTYIIKYTYNIGKDPVKGKDELYFNLIGTDWDTVIGNITFKIEMPKKFDSSKLGFSAGKKGTTESKYTFYTVSGNTITGYYDGRLSAGEALTVRCELEEGYFVGAGIPFNIVDLLVFVIPVLFLGISILLWYKFGRDDQVVETVEFYPPKGFNSLEVGFLYKGYADNEDVTSLLIYLANKGYIKISETEETSLFSKSKGFKITKLKEYDGNNTNERLFLNGLFKKKPTYTSLFSKEKEPVNDNINEVTLSDLYDNFYTTMNKILSNINKKENKNKIFEKTASSKSVFIMIMIFLTFCIITVPIFTTYGDLETLIFALLFPGIGFSIMFGMLSGGNPRRSSASAFVRVFGVIWGVIFGGLPWAFLVLPILLQDLRYFFAYILGLICVFGMTLCIKYLPKRTKYGNEILGKLKGFKNFLETAEKDRIEAMVMNDPEYFYNILPYTYVLGVSDTWIKNFETISLQAPSWYDSPNAFDIITFNSFMHSTMLSASAYMSSSPSSSSSSGGGSSGGGFSGGGSGGGGRRFLVI